MYLDIQLTAIFKAKLAIDLLMENEKGYEAKLLPYINQCTVLLNYPMDQDVNRTCICLVQRPSAGRLPGNPNRRRKMEPVPIAEQRNHLQISDVIL